MQKGTLAGALLEHPSSGQLISAKFEVDGVHVGVGGMVLALPAGA
jgi:hypothetical protein